MGCFLGCFGICTKSKRRKPANRILPGDSKFVSYEPLDSSVAITLDIPENPISSKSQLSNKSKEKSRVKLKKKVRFNLNVQTYEPIPVEETTTYQFLQSIEDEEEENAKNGADAGKGNLFSSSNLLQMGSYPTNYRYQNCIESYDEEDEMAYEESDLEDDDFYYDYEDEDESQGRRREGFLDQLDSLNIDPEKGDSLVQLDEDRHEMPISAVTEGELKSVGCGNVRIKSQYLCSVLNPVESTSQWKEIKARAAAPPKPRRKENIALEEGPQIAFSLKPRSSCSPNYNQSKPLLQDIAVDASLSNWLISQNSGESNTTGSTKDDTLSFKNGTYDSQFSWRRREDRVILDITNLEAL